MLVSRRCGPRYELGECTRITAHLEVILYLYLIRIAPDKRIIGRDYRNVGSAPIGRKSPHSDKVHGTYLACPASVIKLHRSRALQRRRRLSLPMWS
jgi:hypothetical protein